MTRRQNFRTSGFTVIEVLTVIVILAALGGVGVYVYFRSYKHKSIPSVNSPSSMSSSQHVSGRQSSYFTIQEWGIRAPYVGSLNLQYAAVGSNSMALSSSQLASGGPSVCTYISNGEAGILSRYLPTDANLGPGIPVDESAEQYVAQNNDIPHAEIGGYIYIYWGKSYITSGTYNGPCEDKATAIQTIDTLSALVSQFQAIQNYAASDPRAIILQRAQYIDSYDIQKMKTVTPVKDIYDALQSQGYITANYALKLDTYATDYNSLECLAAGIAPSNSYAAATVVGTSATLSKAENYSNPNPGSATSQNVTLSWVNESGTWKLNAVTCQYQ